MTEDRVRRKLTPKNLAKFAHVSEHEYQSWESGHSLPTLLQAQKMYGKNNALLEPLRDAHRVAVIKPEPLPLDVVASPNGLELVTKDAVEMVIPFVVEPIVPDVSEAPAAIEEPAVVEHLPHALPAPLPPTAKVVGEAIVIARVEVGMSREKLARMMGVHGSSVASWERGECLPIASRYDALLRVLPSLQGLPRPVLQDKESPGRKRGQASQTAKQPNDVVGPSVVEAPIQPPPDPADPIAPTEPPTIDTLAALDLVIAAYRAIGTTLIPQYDQQNALWSLTLRDKATGTVVVESVSGTMVEATRRVMIALKNSLAKRVDGARAELVTLTDRVNVLETAFASVSQIATEHGRR
jgi:DNA-binding transcriptional regulator YiaG